LTCNLDFQSQTSWDHDPETQKLKFKGQLVKKTVETNGQTDRQTDRRTDVIDCFTFPAKTVGN